MKLVSVARDAGVAGGLVILPQALKLSARIPEARAAKKTVTQEYHGVKVTMIISGWKMPPIRR